MMRRFALSLLLFTVLSVSGQTVSMREVFRSLPDTIAPYLTENNRLDCIDFLDSNMKAEVHNQLDGKSALLTLNDRYAAMRLNEGRLLELRLLDFQPAGQLVCMVQTYGSDVRESVVTFYTTAWQQLRTDDYVQLPRGMFVATLDEQQPTLTVTPVGFIDRPALEDQKEVELSSTILKWNQNFFK